MNTQGQQNSKQQRPATGLTLVELMAALAVAAVVMLTAALLVYSGHKGWNKAYNDAYSETRLGALDVMTALGSVGRKSNKTDYHLYEVSSNTFTIAVPSSSPDENVTGQAIEFHYWDSELEDDLVDPDITATQYALFYLDDDKLKVDFGPYPPGGVDASGHRIESAYVTTVTLAENIFSVDFSHTARNMTGDGKGCVRMKLVAIDPVDNSVKTTLAASLMRNVWPQ